MNEEKIVKWFYDHEELLLEIMDKKPYQSDGWDYEIEVVKDFLATNQSCYCGEIYNLGVIHRDDGPCHYPEHTSEYKRGYADAMNWKAQNHLEHLPAALPEQEPVAWAENDGDGNVLWNKDSCFSDDPEWLDNPMPLYTTPPQRDSSATPLTWVGLTPQERDEINEQVYGAVPHHVAFHHAIETKLKEKNT